jgi:uncharacterized protein
MVPSLSRSGTSRVRSICLALATFLPVAADHGRDFDKALAGLRAGTTRPMEQVFRGRAGRAGGDQLLSLLELGALAQFRGDFAASRAWLDEADRVAREGEGRALVSGDQTLRTLGAVLVNDGALRYEGAGFEKILGRTLNALNYLFLGDLEGALVEVRKAEEYQVLERRRRKEESRAAPSGPRMGDPGIAAVYGGVARSAAGLPDSLVNPFTCFLASQIHRARGPEGLDDARVDAERALALAPQAAVLREACQEIARAGVAGAPDQGTRGTVVVIFAPGFAPRLAEARLDLPLEGRLYSFAAPVYRDLGRPMAPLVLEAGGRTWTTTLLQDTRRLAARNLQERLPAILARGLAGALAKARIQAEAEERTGPLGGFLAKVATVGGTRADLRSWLGLPAEVQVALCDLPAGENHVHLTTPGLTSALTLQVPTGGRTFLLVRVHGDLHRVDARSLGGTLPVPLPQGAT